MKENRKFIGYYLDEHDQPTNESFIGWNSRSIAITVIVTNFYHSKFLMEVRGKGCPDNIGKLCFPCGYLNWGETLEDAVKRELYEETGINLNNIKKYSLNIIGINDDPINSNRENVTVRYLLELSDVLLNQMLNSGVINNDTVSRGGEADECEDIKYMNIRELQELDDSNFAFNHKELVELTCKYQYKTFK